MRKSMPYAIAASFRHRSSDTDIGSPVSPAKIVGVQLNETLLTAGVMHVGEQINSQIYSGLSRIVCA